MILLLTSGTKAEVRIELDCMKTVNRAPIMMKMYPVNQGTNGRSLERKLLEIPASGMERILFIVLTRKM